VLIGKTKHAFVTLAICDRGRLEHHTGASHVDTSQLCDRVEECVPDVGIRVDFASDPFASRSPVNTEISG
jgi:hypothetical protein